MGNTVNGMAISAVASTQLSVTVDALYGTGDMYADVFDDTHASYNDYNPSELEQVGTMIIVPNQHFIVNTTECKGPSAAECHSPGREVQRHQEASRAARRQLPRLRR